MSAVDRAEYLVDAGVCDDQDAVAAVAGRDAMHHTHDPAAEVSVAFTAGPAEFVVLLAEIALPDVREEPLNVRLLMNGASSSVASLWRVRDQPTAEFMKQFYYYLAAGHSTAGALRQAKLRFLSSPGSLSDPWAAFVASGHGLGKPVIPVSWAAFLTIVAALMAGTGALAAISAHGGASHGNLRPAFSGQRMP
jgi:hypothetical protein